MTNQERLIMAFDKPCNSHCPFRHNVRNEHSFILRIKKGKIGQLEVWARTAVSSTHTLLVRRIPFRAVSPSSTLVFRNPINNVPKWQLVKQFFTRTRSVYTGRFLRASNTAYVEETSVPHYIIHHRMVRVASFSRCNQASLLHTFVITLMIDYYQSRFSGWVLSTKRVC